MAATLTVICLDPGLAAYRIVRRPGRRAAGWSAGGPADGRAAAAAHRLLDQDATGPCLEVTRAGGRWLLSGRGQFVLTGADITWRLNGRILESYQTQYLDGDGLLVGGNAGAGYRGYLAFRGEWAEPNYAPSANLPPDGRLTPGWSAAVVAPTEAAFTLDLDVKRHLPPVFLRLPVRPGPEWPLLTPVQQNNLLSASYFLSPSGNRQGLRLTTRGDIPNLPPLISSPVLPGTLQLTPTGPVLLGPEAQTLGGYPRVLLLADEDALGLAYQLRPGKAVGLRLVG